MSHEVGLYHSEFNLPGIIARDFIDVKEVLNSRSVGRHDQKYYPEMLVNKQQGT